MLIKIIKSLIIIILLVVLSLLVVGIFNPFNLRNKLISSMLNMYLSHTIDGYTAPIKTNNNSTKIIDKNPLLNAEQEKTLEDLGVNVEQLPTEITPTMEECFLKALGQERVDELSNGATLSPIDVVKTQSCL